MSDEYYELNEIDKCPICDSKNRDNAHEHCWHCLDCGYGICEFTKDEIKTKRAVHKIEEGLLND